MITSNAIEDQSPHTPQSNLRRNNNKWWKQPSVGKWN